MEVAKEPVEVFPSSQVSKTIEHKIHHQGHRWVCLQEGLRCGRRLGSRPIQMKMEMKFHSTAADLYPWRDLTKTNILIVRTRKIKHGPSAGTILG